MTDAAATPKEKTSPTTRVYPVTDKSGVKRYVECTSAAIAITHVYKPEVGRPLSGSETTALIRAIGISAIEVAKS